MEISLHILYGETRIQRHSAHTQRVHFRTVFQYDAFISYADENRDIILGNFMSEIEKKSNLKLCLHDRDFIPGFDIAENIANAIRDSCKIVCIVSNNYLSSHWCMYEFNMALMERIHARGEDSMLILVLLSVLDIQKAPMPMMELIRNNTYIELPEDSSYHPLFWSKLSDVLR